MRIEKGKYNMKMMDHKNRFKPWENQVWFVLIMILLIFICVGCEADPYDKFEKSIESADYVAAVEIYNQELLHTEEQEKADESLISHIDTLIQSYESGELTYEKATERLQPMLEIENNIIVAKINEFIYESETIQTAERLYDDGMFEESFVILAIGLQEYPESERLSSALVDFCDHYVITITQQVQTLCEEEKYKEAIDVLEKALDAYECEEFSYLLESTKEQKSKLYKLKNDIVDKVKALTDGWTAEEFDVKQAANDTGAYILKSGKKLMLGDYTEDEITVLSLTGNVASSIAGVDLLFDLRDLSYDITHWGEEEYFVAYLAADVVALIPVIGAVKYFDHFKDTTKVVESVTDLEKNKAKAEDMIDAAAEAKKAVGKSSDFVKKKDKAENIADAAKYLSKADNLAKDSDTAVTAKKYLKNITKQYEPVTTSGQKYLGTVNRDGVKYKLVKVTYSDGRKIQGVFPQFKSFFDVQLEDNLIKASFDEQKRYCMKKLQKDTKSIFSKTKKIFNEQQLIDIENGNLPENYVWHHNEQEGLMQLVDRETHVHNGHTGGMNLWGIKYNH